MYTEIIKILEAGMALDRKKMVSYARVLADNLAGAGDLKFADRIRQVISHTHGSLATLDSLGAKPVDSESHLEIVDVTRPTLGWNQLMLNGQVASEIREFVAGYGKREELQRSGIEVFNSLLLYGPPGCGKTSVANLIASEVGLPLVTARFDALVSSLLGSTAKNIRKVFEYASLKPCVLFLDEFDVIAKMRDDKNELGELKRVVNGLLQEMDAFSPESILIAATNHHELLDRAVWRRFGKVLALDLPSADLVAKTLRLNLSGRDDGFAEDPRTMKRIVAALSGVSHSGIRTVTQNAIRSAVLGGREKVSRVELVREIYLSRRHGLTDETDFIRFLIGIGFTHLEMHDQFGLPLRSIREISRDLRREKKGADE